MFVDLESRSWEEYYDGEEEEWVPVIRKESGERGGLGIRIGRR